jgi:protein SHQ1
MDDVTLHANLDENEDDIDWSFPQEIEHELNLRVQGDVKYGFNRQYSHFFDHVQDEISEIVDNPNPNSVPPQDIRQMRVEDENEKFDIDHYLYALLRTHSSD